MTHHPPMPSVTPRTRSGLLPRPAPLSSGDYSSRCGLLALLLTILPGLPARAALPPGFVAETRADQLALPVALAFDPAGNAYVAEKEGLVKRIDAVTAAATTVLDLRSEVNGQGDRGLLGLALAPDFSQQPHLYLLYTIDPIQGEPDEGADSATWGRLTRYTLDAAGLTAHPESRTVLLGETSSTGFPICYTTHTVGSLAFLPDGTLVASAGDGAHFDYYVDDGSNQHPEDARCEEVNGQAQDVGAFRSQSLETLAGKLVRIDPETGHGLPDNPLYDGDPHSLRSRIWSSGLRNPWRITVDPGSGGIWVGDVGESRYEELSLAFGGENFGWPCYEGPVGQDQYLAAGVPAWGCETLETPTNPFPLAAPTFYWHHADPTLFGPEALYKGSLTGASALAGAVYGGSSYPDRYRNRLLFGDFSGGWMLSAGLTADGTGLQEVEDFADDIPGPVDLEVSPLNGNLYFLSIYLGALVELRYEGASNGMPVAVASASVLAGEVPLEVQLSSAGSSDPEGEPLRYHWSFGDGSSSDEAHPLHLYTLAGTYSVVLTVTDAADQHASSLPITIHVGNLPPSAIILSPEDGDLFSLPHTFSLVGDGIDSSSPPSDLTFRWSLTLHHNDHYHPDYQVVYGQVASMSISSIDENGHLEFRLRVTDPAGAWSEDVVHLYPSNQGPEFVPIAPQQVVVGSTLVMPLEAVDPEGDPVQISASSVPPGAVLGPDHVLRWTPTSLHIGTWNARFEAVDENPAPMTDSLSVQITVVPSSSTEVNVRITGDWGAGFCVDLSWANQSSSIVRDWSIWMPLEASLSGGWNAVFTPVSGGYQITPLEYNRTVAPGAALGLGFCASGSGRPTVATITTQTSSPPPPAQANLQLTVRETGRWPGGSCGELAVFNSGTLPVIGWQGRFDVSVGSRLASLWNVAWTAQGQRVEFENLDWNARVDPGQTHLAGLCLEGDGTVLRLEPLPR